MLSIFEFLSILGVSLAHFLEHVVQEYTDSSLTWSFQPWSRIRGQTAVHLQSNTLLLWCFVCFLSKLEKNKPYWKRSALCPKCFAPEKSQVLQQTWLSILDQIFVSFASTRPLTPSLPPGISFSLHSSCFSLPVWATFAPSFYFPPSLHTALFTVWKTLKLPATTYYKMHSSRAWISV